MLHKYEGKSEVVAACMTSVHIPLFLDGRPMRRPRAGHGWCIDGSVGLRRSPATAQLCGLGVERGAWVEGPEVSALGAGLPRVLRVHHKFDKELHKLIKPGEFLALKDFETIVGMMECGYMHGREILDSGLVGEWLES